jgi:ethanolamine ammonia-lyase small subunit
MSDAIELLREAEGLARWTEARVGLGRVGASAPSRAVLEFGLDHARARDAIHAGMPVERLATELEGEGFGVLRVQSEVRDRVEYLRRPDLGRRLDEGSRALLGGSEAKSRRLTVVVADGLSALAPASHAVPVLRLLREALEGWELDDVVLATEARVALGDEVGALRGAEAVLVLIGERPGLKSFDSLGAYLTYGPRVGRTDAERNCVSNIRRAGLSYEEAVYKVLHLLAGARLLGVSGVRLKDESDGVALPGRDGG